MVLPGRPSTVYRMLPSLLQPPWGPGPCCCWDGHLLFCFMLCQSSANTCCC